MSASGEPRKKGGTMPRKRVIAHFMHEDEMLAVVPLLVDGTVTDGFAVALGCSASDSPSFIGSAGA